MSAFATIPRFRGVLHKWAFLASLPAGLWLMSAAQPDQLVAIAVYVLSLSGLLAASSAYHRVGWRPRVRRWMRRLDHAMIFALIAGTFTPIVVLSIRTEFAYDVLRLRKAGKLSHEGRRMNLGVATGSSASQKKRVIYFEDEFGSGEYKLTVFFTSHTEERR